MVRCRSIRILYPLLNNHFLFTFFSILAFLSASCVKISETGDHASPGEQSGLVIPNEVLHFSVVPNSPTSVRLTFSTGGGSTAGFIVAYQPTSPPDDCFGPQTILIPNPSITSTIVTGLAAGTQYFFRLCASNGGNPALFSAGLTQSATPLQGPNEVAAFTATPSSGSATSLQLYFGSGGGTTAGFVIAYQANAIPANCQQDANLISINDPTTTSYTLSNLVTNTPYGIRICAINADAPPLYSIGLTQTATPQGGPTSVAIPLDPINPSAVLTGSNSIQLTWSNPAGMPLGQTYVVAIASNSSTPPPNCNGASAAVSPLSFSNLASDTPYSFRICGALSSVYSAGATATKTTSLLSPSKLLLSLASPVTAGVCTPLTVTTENSSSQIANATSAISISLAGNPLGNFYASISGTTCTTPITGTTINAGTSSTKVYFQVTSLGSMNTTTVTVADLANVLTSATLSNVALVPGPATNLSTTVPKSVTYNQCSKAFSISLVDAFGNSASIASGDYSKFVFSSGNTGDQFYSDVNCLDKAGSAGQGSAYFYSGDVPYQSLYLIAGSSGGRTFTASATDFLSGQSIQAASQGFSAGGGPIDHLAITSNDSAVTIGQCGAYTLSAMDKWNNPATLSTNVSGSIGAAPIGLIYSDKGCNTNISQLSVLSSSTGSAQLFYFKSPVSAGQSTLTFSNATYSATYPVLVQTTNPAINLSLFGLNSPFVANPNCNGIQIALADQSGNPTSQSLASSITVSLTMLLGSGSFYSTPNCAASSEGPTAQIPAGQSTGMIYFVDPKAEPVKINAMASGLGNATLSKTVEASAPSNLAANLSSALVDRTCTPFTVSLIDINRDPSPSSTPFPFGIAVTSSPSANVAVYSDIKCTNAVTQYTVATNQTLYIESQQTASVWGFSPVNVKVTFTPANLPTATYNLSTTENTQFGSFTVTNGDNYGPIFPLSTGTCSTILFTTTDISGNAANVTTNLVISVSITGHGNLLNGYGGQQISSLTIPSGQNNASICFASTYSIENVTFTATSPNLPSFVASGQVLPASPYLSINLPTSPLKVNTCYNGTANYVDYLGNPVFPLQDMSFPLPHNATGLFYSDGACKNQATTVGTLAAGTSTFNFGFLSKASFNGTIYGSTPNYSTKGTTITMLPLATSAFQLNGPTALQPNICTGPYEATAEDSFNNPTPLVNAENLTFTVPSGNGLFSDSQCTSAFSNDEMAAGQDHIVFYLKASNAENLTIELSTTHFGGATLSVVSSVPTSNQWQAAIVDSGFAVHGSAPVNDALLLDPNLVVSALYKGLMFYSPSNQTWGGSVNFAVGWDVVSDQVGSWIRNSFYEWNGNQFFGANLMAYRPDAKTYLPCDIYPTPNHEDGRYLAAVPSFTPGGRLVFLDQNNLYLIDPAHLVVTSLAFPNAAPYELATAMSDGYAFFWGNFPNNGGVLLNISAGTQTNVTGVGAPANRSDPFTFNIGGAYLVYGGGTGTTAAGGNPAADTLVYDGAIYHVASGVWKTINSAGAPSNLATQSAVWTGNQMVVCGVPSKITPVQISCFSYNPATDQWSALPAITSTSGLLNPDYTADIIAADYVGGGPLLGWTGTSVIAYQFGYAHNTAAQLPLNLNQ